MSHFFSCKFVTLVSLSVPSGSHIFFFQSARPLTSNAGRKEDGSESKNVGPHVYLTEAKWRLKMFHFASLSFYFIRVGDEIRVSSEKRRREGEEDLETSSFLCRCFFGGEVAIKVTPDKEEEAAVTLRAS